MSASGGQAGGGTSPRRLPRYLVPALVVLCASFGMVTVSPASALVIVVEAPLALLILLAGFGVGSRWLPIFRPGEMDAATGLILSTGLGLGILSVAVLAAGSAGILSPQVWWVVVLVAVLAGLPALRRLVWGKHRANSDARPADGGRDGADRTHGLWLAVIASAAMGLLVASLPAGILWPAEGNGYDVLEYHLGALRDYQDAGLIHHLPHNIYSNFPFGVEMLYLLGMILRGDPLRAAFTAQFLHMMLGFLAAGATYCAARSLLADGELKRRGAAHVGAIAVATCPFVIYVGALAYVENALLLYSALALVAVHEAGRERQGNPPGWFALAGAMAGFAFGCKYIAGPQVVLPLGLAVAWVAGRRRQSIAKALAAYGIAALFAASPWLVRNGIHTGNPVFPLARAVFGEKAGTWNDDGAARWAEGHLPGPEHRSIGGRMERTWTQILYNPLYGPVMVVGFAAGLFAIVRSGAFSALVPCVVLFAGTMVTWLGFTHLVDRFAMVGLAPAAVLISVVFATVLKPLQRAGLAATMVLVNVLLSCHLLITTQTSKLLQARETSGIEWFAGGEWPSYQHVPKLNEIVRGGGKVLMVADARRFYLDRGVDYCVVFNRNPFAEAAERSSPKELIAWLREHGYTHVFVNWSEMQRLRESRYGFWASVDVNLFKRLNEAGLQVADNYSLEGKSGSYGTLFRIPN